MNPSEFEKIAWRAIESLPAEFKPYVEGCMLLIEPQPKPELLLELDIAEDEGLYGLYEGAALTDRSRDDPPDLPPRVTLFYEPLIEDFGDNEQDLIHEIQVTVLHEIGHHFGLDEDRLEELGFA